MSRKITLHDTSPQTPFEALKATTPGAQTQPQAIDTPSTPEPSANPLARPVEEHRTESDPNEEEFTVTTFRITRAQHLALKEEAFLRSQAKRKGTVEQSVIMREILDIWMKQRKSAK